MPNMKRFLEAETTFNRILYTFLTVFSLGAVGVFAFFILSSGFPIWGVLIPGGPFLVVGLFFGRGLLKSFHNYDDWWNSLPEDERMEIEDDYNHAEQVSHYFIAGQKYAFLRQSGRPLPYTEVGVIEMLPHSKSHHCSLIIKMRSGKGSVYCDLPSYADADDLYNDLVHRADEIIVEEYK